jgi:hypothetical protein
MAIVNTWAQRDVFWGTRSPSLASCTPFSFNPKSQTFYFDVECPIMPEYVEQLASPKSVASKHLARYGIWHKEAHQIRLSLFKK